VCHCLTYLHFEGDYFLSAKVKTDQFFLPKVCLMYECLASSYIRPLSKLLANAVSQSTHFGQFLIKKNFLSLLFVAIFLVLSYKKSMPWPPTFDAKKLKQKKQLTTQGYRENTQMFPVPKKLK